MKRILLITLLALMALSFLAACGGKNKVPTEDSITATQSFELAESLRKAYVARDFNAMKRLCTEEAYESIRIDVKEFKSATLTFTPQWIDIDPKGVLALRIKWEGSWVVPVEGTKDTKTEERTGTLVLQMSGSPLKVSKVVQGSPFSQPGYYKGPTPDMLQ